MSETYMIPRILIAGANSGCGKTTITCAILKGLVERGFSIQPYKCGPDYIDPMLHTHITKKACRNLDPFFLETRELEQIFIKDAKKAEIAVIEGVMGFYDGIGMTMKASTHSVAEAIKAPVILVINVKGMANTMIPLLKGLMEYNYGDNQIKGVILNRCTKGLYEKIMPLIEKELGLSVVGYFPFNEKVILPSRHLGLMTAEEIENLDEIMGEIGRIASETIDFNKILALAKGASVMEEREKIKREKTKKKVKIAVALDRAFCFYYKENLEILEELGAELCYFSPIAGSKLPEKISGIYLGGGYPEAYLEQLSHNQSMLEEMRQAYKENLPILAECGGFMYLCKEIIDTEGKNYAMSGLLDTTISMTEKLNMQFGYVTATAGEDNVFVKAGEKIRAHEFHYSKADPEGETFEMEKHTGKKWKGIYQEKNLMAGYPHWYFRNSMSLAENFVKACEQASKIEEV